MNLKKMLLIAAVILTAFSCKKSPTDPVKEEDKKTSKKLLVKITEVTNGTTLFTNLTYNTENQLISQKSSRQDIKYSYNQGRIFQIESNTLDQEFTYESGLLKKINNKSNAAKPIVFDLVLTYQGTRLIHTERIEDKVAIFKEDLQYTGENISISLRTDEKYVYKYELTYDDKKNINFGLGADVLLGISLSSNQLPTLNNFISEKYTLLQDGKALFSITTNYEYTYDSEGYPLTCIKKLQQSAQATPVETRYAYEYKVVE